MKHGDLVDKTKLNTDMGRRMLDLESQLVESKRAEREAVCSANLLLEVNEALQRQVNDLGDKLKTSQDQLKQEMKFGAYLRGAYNTDDLDKITALRMQSDGALSDLLRECNQLVAHNARLIIALKNQHQPHLDYIPNLDLTVPELLTESPAVSLAEHDAQLLEKYATRFDVVAETECTMRYGMLGPVVVETAKGLFGALSEELRREACKIRQQSTGDNHEKNN